MPSKKAQKRERKQRKVGAAILQREREQAVSCLERQYLREQKVRNRAQKRS